MATKKSKKNEKKTYVAIIIDRSGSMGGVRREAWQGLNEQIRVIKENAEKGGDTKITIVQFDNEFEVLRDNVAPAKIHEIDESEYSPRGSTALYDAMARTIEMLEKQEQTEDTGFLVITISDGEENSSTQWSGPRLKSKIQELEATDKWTFTYMLANVDLNRVLMDLGGHSGNMSKFASTPDSYAQASLGSSGASVNYMSSRSAGVRSLTAFNGNGDSFTDYTNKSSAPAPTVVTPSVASGIQIAGNQLTGLNGTLNGSANGTATTIDQTVQSTFTTALDKTKNILSR